MMYIQFKENLIHDIFFFFIFFFFFFFFIYILLLFIYFLNKYKGKKFLNLIYNIYNTYYIYNREIRNNKIK